MPRAENGPGQDWSADRFAVRHAVFRPSANLLAGPPDIELLEGISAHDLR